MRERLHGNFYEPLLRRAGAFVEQQAAKGEVLVLAATRDAADDLVRLRCGDTAGVHRFTVGQWIAALSAGPMAERGLAPLNALGAQALAARAVHEVETESGLEYFGPVASSPGFARALARTLRELRMEEVSLPGLARTGKPGYDLASLARTYEELLRECRLADFAELTKLACEALGESRFRGMPVLLLDLEQPDRLTSRLLEEMAGHSRAVLEIGLGEGSEGAEADTALGRLRQRVFIPGGDAAAGSDASLDVFSAAGEGLESTEIARRIQQLAGEGIPFDDMAILLRAPARYQPLLEESLQRAGIPFHFTHGGARPDAAGRAFLALLECAREGYPATRFAEYLSLGQSPALEAPRAMAACAVGAEDELLAGARASATVEEESEESGGASPATPAAWERLIVDAAVVGGKDRWERRLRGLENEFRLRLTMVKDGNEAERAHIERQIDLLSNLQRLALPLIERFDAFPQRARWRDWLMHLSELAELSLARPAPVQLALNELWPMGDIGPVGLDEVIPVLSERLRFLRRPPQKRRYGKVWIATMDEARGTSFAAVFVPGLAEGIFPKKMFEDPLLLDEARRLSGEGLPLREDRVAEERTRLRIAAAVARRRLIVSYPRMDVAQNRPRVPSFYAMEAVRAAEGRLPELKAFERRAAQGSRTRLGWPAPVEAAESVDALEYDLSVLHGAVSAPRGKAKGWGRYLMNRNPHLTRSLRARYRRWDRKRWTADDGLYEASPATLEALAKHGLQKRSWSASTLQQFAACPYRFFLHGVHRFRPREESAPLEELDPLTRGSLFHEVVFELFRRGGAKENFAAIADGVFDEVAARYEETLAPAIPRVWKSEMEDLRADLKGWLRRLPEDAKGWEVIHSEFAFGMEADGQRDPQSRREPARLLDGVLVRGSVDWIERHVEAGTLRITDHKTGRNPKDKAHHIGGGLILQPLLYALSVEYLLRQPVQFSRLYYCTQRGNYDTAPVAITEHSKLNLRRALEIIDGGVTGGCLPAAPAEGQCEWCDYRMVCGPREEERTRRKPRIAELVELRGLP
ncbi:MAG: PD-(D/E)XK nuclease family protein [Bryobacterales bacterium]|nr:PD-(D/E)XK nuclease family protein [Bryobacterales bacterium]